MFGISFLSDVASEDLRETCTIVSKYMFDINRFVAVSLYFLSEIWRKIDRIIIRTPQLVISYTVDSTVLRKIVKSKENNPNKISPSTLLVEVYVSACEYTGVNVD
jgi:hypothetical protein